MKADVQLAVTLDIPKLDVDVKQVHNVDSACNPASPALAPGKVYQNLTLLTPSIGFDASEVFTEEGKIPWLDLQANQGFNQSYSRKLPTACYFFDAAKKSLVSAPITKPFSLSSASGNHVPFTALLVAIVIMVLTVI